MRTPNVPNANFLQGQNMISQVWLSFFQNLITQLRINFNDSGYKFPFLDDASIAQLTGDENIGKIVYNSTTQRMMVNNSGTFVNILT